jgi:lipopolysaccharide exporter
MPITWLTLALARPLIVTVYGAKWVGAAPVLSVLTAYGAISVLCLLLSNLLVGLGRPRLLLYVQLVWLVVLVPVMGFSVHRFGLLGAGYAHIGVILLLVAPIYLAVIGRSTSVRFGELLRALLPSTVAAAIAAAAATGAVRLVGPAALQLVLGAAVGGLVYALAISLELRTLVSLSSLRLGPLTPVVSRYDALGEYLVRVGRTRTPIQPVDSLVDETVSPMQEERSAH